jgi:DDE superfamily endonuclease
LCHLDEAGFAPTLPTTYSWSPVGERLGVPYEAPQGRRVNALGAYFSHGPLAGEFHFASWASLPTSRAKQPPPLAAQAAAHGLTPEQVGRIDSERLLAFIWEVAGRPTVHAENWRRERPLVIVLDNYSVHKSDAVREAQPALAAANVELWYLPAYAPELSEIEPVWHDVKHHQLRDRSHPVLGGLKQAVDAALARQADALRSAHPKPEDSLRRAA